MVQKMVKLAAVSSRISYTEVTLVSLGFTFLNYSRILRNYEYVG